MSAAARPRGLERALLVALGLGFVAVALVAIAHRGPWYDELYTYYMTRPGVPFAQLWSGWLRDNHPPTFYFLAWLADGFGADLARHRLVNLVIAGAMLAALAGLVRAAPALRPLVFPYLVALASYSPAVLQVVELRSNFLAYASAALAVAALSGLVGLEVALEPGAEARPRAGQAFLRGPRAFVLGAVLALAFCVHLAETVIVAGLAMAFGFRLVLARAWGRAGRLLLVGALAGVPFALAMALQLGTIASNTRVFWIAGGLDAARWAIENEVVANLAANPVLTLTGLAGLVLLFGQDLARRRLSARSALVLTLGAGLALAVAMLVAIHLHRPFLLSRYLVALHPPAGMILAVGAASLIERLGRRGQAALLVALVAGAGWAMVGQLARVERLTSWDGTGAAIARIVQACPRTQVHPDTAWNRMTLELPPRDNREVIPFAYRWIAARHGFALAPAGSRTREGACPTVFWTEHVAGQSPSAGAIAASLRARGFAIGAGYVQRIGDGWILVVPAQG